MDVEIFTAPSAFQLALGRVEIDALFDPGDDDEASILKETSRTDPESCTIIEGF